MKDCEQTITIDFGKLPEKYRTGKLNPFERLNKDQLRDVLRWVGDMVPSGEYCAEIIGRCPSAVAFAVGGVLAETGCQKLTTTNPWGEMMTVWDLYGDDQ